MKDEGLPQAAIIPMRSGEEQLRRHRHKGPNDKHEREESAPFTSSSCSALLDDTWENAKCNCSNNREGQHVSCWVDQRTQTNCDSNFDCASYRGLFGKAREREAHKRREENCMYIRKGSARVVNVEMKWNGEHKKEEPNSSSEYLPYKERKKEEREGSRESRAESRRPQ